MNDFQLVEVFFSKVNIQRDPQVPDPLRIQAQIEALISVEGPLGIVVFTMSTVDDANLPVRLDLQLIGKYARADQAPGPIDGPSLQAFLHSKGLAPLWAYAEHMTRQVTAMMGMPAVVLEMPVELLAGPQKTP